MSGSSPGAYTHARTRPAWGKAIDSGLLTRSVHPELGERLAVRMRRWYRRCQGGQPENGGEMEAATCRGIGMGRPGGVTRSSQRAAS